MRIQSSSFVFDVAIETHPPPSSSVICHHHQSRAYATVKLNVNARMHDAHHSRFHPSLKPYDTNHHPKIFL